MTSFIRPISAKLAIVRVAPIAALMGAAILACPITAAHAESLKTRPVLMAQAAPTNAPAAAQMAAEKPETVEARIADLRAKLKITAEQESKWNDVAKVMRDNATQMEKLVADKKAQTPQNMTAIDDLITYQKFSQAHVDGLKSLIAAFKTLYDAMPADQKLIADQTFMQHGRSTAPAHG